MGKLNQFLKNLALFFVIFFIVNYLMNAFFKKDQVAPPANQVIIQSTESEYSRRDKIAITITNTTTETVTIGSQCPEPPLQVSKKVGNNWENVSAKPEIDCTKQKDLVIATGESAIITFTEWNNALFGEMGRFRTETNLTINGEELQIVSNEFLVEREGIFGSLWHAIYRLIYNILIALVAFIPGHLLGIGIILLTVIIRTVLLVPSQKALKAQRRIQEMQPRLEKIKEKYKGDQQRIALETMAIWRAEKISPLSGCLPILLQLPFLIALFYVVKDGLIPDNSYLLYTNYNNFSLANINPQFLGMNLTEVNLYVLPLIVGALQFIQMKMASAKLKNKKDDGAKFHKEMRTATNTMTYILPVLIAVFTASLPAGVGLYWGASTLYGIVQQYFVNKGSSSQTDEPVVRVIEAKDDK